MPQPCLGIARQDESWHSRLTTLGAGVYEKKKQKRENKINRRPSLEDTSMAPKTLDEVVAMPSIIAVCFRNARLCIVRSLAESSLCNSGTQAAA
jgi:hypothetical protein